MKLQGRDLASGLRGDDVSLLQFELRQLGFPILDPEVTRKFFGNTTLEAVKLFQKNHQLRETGVVEETTATAINLEFDALPIVQGQVWQDDDTPLSVGKVLAFDKDLRSEQPLGQSDIAYQGRYEIRYLPEKFMRHEKRLADLFLRVLDSSGKLLFESDVIFNVPPKQTVDIVLAQPPRLSEFQAYMNDVDPLLERVTLAELNEADVDFIANETGIPVMHLAFLVVAHQYQATHAMDADLFYGLFREDTPTSLPTLLMQSSTTLRSALDAAIEHNIIRPRLEAELDQALALLLRQRREHLLKSAGENPAPAALLDAAGLSADQHGQFLEAYLNFDGEAEAFWTSLAQTSLSGQVLSIQNSLQLGLLTQNNIPLFKTLGNLRIRSIRDLTRIKPDELQRILLGSKEILAAIPAEDDSENEETKARRFSNELFDV
ncbi:MAG: peptidoglycan-binding protein, partial [Pirellulaceae bacterium]|nr:peptidoglycan-binding protein [Pirellulaceae bacterium]